MGNKEYIEQENLELERLEERFNLLKNKWFRKEGVREEIDFLENYIKHKKNLIKNISEKNTNGK